MLVNIEAQVVVKVARRPLTKKQRFVLRHDRHPGVDVERNRGCRVQGRVQARFHMRTSP